MISHTSPIIGTSLTSKEEQRLSELWQKHHTALEGLFAKSSPSIGYWNDFLAWIRGWRYFIKSSWNDKDTTHKQQIGTTICMLLFLGTTIGQGLTYNELFINTVTTTGSLAYHLLTSIFLPFSLVIYASVAFRSRVGDLWHYALWDKRAASKKKNDHSTVPETHTSLFYTLKSMNLIFCLWACVCLFLSTCLGFIRLFSNDIAGIIVGSIAGSILSLIYFSYTKETCEDNITKITKMHAGTHHKDLNKRHNTWSNTLKTLLVLGISSIVFSGYSVTGAMLILQHLSHIFHLQLSTAVIKTMALSAIVPTMWTVFFSRFFSVRDFFASKNEEWWETFQTSKFCTPGEKTTIGISRSQLILETVSAAPSAIIGVHFMLHRLFEGLFIVTNTFSFSAAFFLYIIYAFVHANFGLRTKIAIPNKDIATFNFETLPVREEQQECIRLLEKPYNAGRDPHDDDYIDIHQLVENDETFFKRDHTTFFRKSANQANARVASASDAVTDTHATYVNP